MTLGGRSAVGFRGRNPCPLRQQWRERCCPHPPPIPHPHPLPTPPIPVLQATDVWAQLAQLKHVVSEPRGGGGEELRGVMTEYYEAIEGGKGGLFMAVCRGKVGCWWWCWCWWGCC